MLQTTTETDDRQVSAKSYLSWLSVVYILCYAPIYFFWNLSPAQRWGELLFFAAIPSSVIALVVNTIANVSIRLAKRRIADPLRRERYATFNRQLIRRTFIVLMSTVVLYNILVRRQIYGPDEAKIRILYLPVMLIPLLPLLTIQMRNLGARMKA